MDDLLLQSQKEIDRLVRNRASFYKIVPDMIFIIKDFLIEDMNPSAVEHLGNLRGQKCHQAIFRESGICSHSCCPIKDHPNLEGCGELTERQVGDSWFEYVHVPFEGYSGDKLVMLIMRDVTRRKRFETELNKYNTSIENVLNDKIQQLEESENVRKKLAKDINVLKRELLKLRKSDTMIGTSKAIKDIRDMIYQVADSSATILITGESGTGKELISDLIYKHSGRCNGPYLKFNCAAVPETLLESDLFGYEKGAFTGAHQSRKGKFEIANGGTIFLDEIGDISPKMQASLLRVLQNGEIIRVGGNSSLSVDVRVIAATNVELEKAVNKGTFRSDLYYRLNVINLHLPPLRERKEDIAPLAVHFLDKYRKAFKKNIQFLPESIIDSFNLYDWPGNIRELENIIQRAVLLAKNDSITIDQIDSKIRKGLADDSQLLSFDNSYLEKPLSDTVGLYERKIILAALQKWKGQAQTVSDRLNISKTSLYEKMKRYGISAKSFKK